MKLRFRAFNRLYAYLRNFYWLPCPICGKMFGGHEFGWASAPHIPAKPSRRAACKEHDVPANQMEWDIEYVMTRLVCDRERAMALLGITDGLSVHDPLLYGRVDPRLNATPLFTVGMQKW